MCCLIRSLLNAIFCPCLIRVVLFPSAVVGSKLIREFHSFDGAGALEQHRHENRMGVGASLLVVLAVRYTVRWVCVSLLIG